MFGRSTDQITEDRADTARHRTDGVAVEHPEPELAQQERRRRFGGLNAGAAFFGWLVAVAVSVLLTGVIGALAAAVGTTARITQDEAQRRAGTIGLVAAIVLLVVLMLGYYCGGYVAGRMSRFSGSAQGLGVWVIGLLVSVLMLTLGAAFGDQYDVLTRTDLPRLPVSTGALGTTGIVAAVILLVGTLLSALAGGSVGTHYHRRVDRAGTHRREDRAGTP